VAMRDLFISEQRYIRNIVWKYTQFLPKTCHPVVVEYYAPPRTSSRVRFNNDFRLQFVPSDRLINFKSFGAHVLPNTLGIDVFVTVDQQTSEPLMTELLGGEAFSIEYFKEHVEKVEHRLAELSHPINLRQVSYCRIFVIENDICFLAFPNGATPVVGGKREVLCADATSSIACGIEGDELVYVDGWIRTNVPESERKLEVVWCPGPVS
jgi:hypothetical protein